MVRSEAISFEQAQRLILGAVETLGSEVARLEEGSGRVLAEEVRAARDYPLAPRAAMDGYAVRSGDLAHLPPEGTVLRVMGRVGPAASGESKIGQGEAVRMLTGGPLPEGADAVAPQETVEAAPGGIRLRSAVRPGDYVAPAGSEARAGQLLMVSGTVLGAVELTVLADLGHREVGVRRRPRVAVMATGDELVGGRETGGPLTVYPSNLQLLRHLVGAAGGEAVSLEVVGDQSDLLDAALRRGLDVEVVITTGGTGKGDRDLVTAAVEELGGELLFRGVAMRPGRQTLCARVGHTLLFGLPGRPPAAYISFLQLVRPALLKMLGLSQVFPPEITARLDRPLGVPGDLTSFIPCRLYLEGDGPEVSSMRPEGLGLMAQMLAATSLLVVRPGRERLEAGERVRVQLLNVGLAALSYFVAPG
ncbi:MAG TPA: gephyrin-like molybdotransferase Glp [Syntrophobacteria bacterium]|nr:gephyrin-like molybdotransferase Glp [Syntrophobacteria bacterium]